MQGWFNICKSINVIQHINRSKDKKPLDHLNRCRKSLQQDPIPLHDKSSKKSRNRRNVPQHHTANIILNSEKLKHFPLKSGMRQAYALSPLLFNIVLEFLARAIRQEEEIKETQVDKETVKIFLFADNMLLYLKDPKNLRHHKQLYQSGRIQNQITKIISFFIHQQ
jgi:hypothetical protein